MGVGTVVRLNVWEKPGSPGPSRGTRSLAGLLACLWLAIAGAGSAHAGAHIWNTRPADYQLLDPFAAADHVITYQIDLAGFNLLSGKWHSPAELADLSEGVRQAFETWNQVLEPIGLQFAEAQEGEGVELAVRALAYDRFQFGLLTNDSIAVSLGWPFQRVYTILPIWFDAAEDLANLRDRPALTDHLLSQPYVKIVDSDQYDIYSVALHELGHVVGLGHVTEAIRTGTNYNFLGMTTVLLQADCLEPSSWVGGLTTATRRPILETELPTIMIPIRRGTVTRTIPPDDRATVAFLLRHVNPAGADQVLAQAQDLYRQSSPLRFANVRYELEKNNGFDRNSSLESAMPVEPNQVILASLFGEDADGGPRDTDYYRLDLSAWPAGTPIVLDIDEAGGLLDTGAEGLLLQLLDEQGNMVALGHPAGTLDPDSYDIEDPLLNIPLPSPGVYYIQVQQPDDAKPGMYVLKIGVGGPVEPADPVQPTIDAAGSQDCPTVTPSASICPAVGFTVLSLAAMALFALRPGRRTL